MATLKFLTTPEPLHALKSSVVHRHSQVALRRVSHREQTIRAKLPHQAAHLQKPILSVKRRITARKTGLLVLCWRQIKKLINLSTIYITVKQPTRYYPKMKYGMIRLKTHGETVVYFVESVENKKSAPLVPAGSG